MDDIASVCEPLESHSSFLIAVHAQADLDTLGSAIGLGETLEGRTRIVAPDGIRARAKRLPRELDVSIAGPDDVELSEEPCLVILDAPSSDRIEPLQVEAASGEVPSENQADDIVLIDHHEPADLVDIATESYVDTDAGATATLVVRICEAMDRRIDSTAGVALATALFDDTDSLAEASAEEFTSFARAVEAATEQRSAIPRILDRETSFGKRAAAAKGVVRSKGYRADQTIVMTTSVSGEQSAAAGALSDGGADVSLVFSDRDERIWVVARAGPDVIHLPDAVFTPLVEQFGGHGGGHADSGVAKLEADSVDEVRTHALERVESALDAPLSELS